MPIKGRVDRAAFRAKTEEATKALEEFKPDVIIVSLGFDAHRNDPITDDHGRRRGFLG